MAPDGVVLTVGEREVRNACRGRGSGSPSSTWRDTSSPHAPVSTPIEWDELESVDPAAFTVRTIPGRLAATGDPWARMHARPGTIDALLGWRRRDLDDGLGELPFLPDFPKMPGEPPRVQPSRARKT